MSEILTLRAYFAERERSQGRFLAEALLDLFEDRRIATSVMLRGIAGFGPANVTRSDRSLSLSEDPPVTIGAVDTAERITALADEVAGLVGRGVITLERSHLLPAALTDTVDTMRLSLHVGRRHRIADAPGYVAVCDVLHRHGFAGADVYLGVDGTVAGQRRRARFFSRNGDVPLSIVGIGTGVRRPRRSTSCGQFCPTGCSRSGPVLVCKDDGHAPRPPDIRARIVPEAGRAHLGGFPATWSADPSGLDPAAEGLRPCHRRHGAACDLGLPRRGASTG